MTFVLHWKQAEIRLPLFMDSLKHFIYLCQNWQPTIRRKRNQIQHSLWCEVLGLGFRKCRHPYPRVTEATITVVAICQSPFPNSKTSLTCHNSTGWSCKERLETDTENAFITKRDSTVWGKGDRTGSPIEQLSKLEEKLCLYRKNSKLSLSWLTQYKNK